MPDADMVLSDSSPKRNLYRYDPVAAWLLEKWPLPPPLWGVLVIPLGTGLYLFTALVSNTLWSKPGQMGLLQDWLPWVWVLLVMPVVLGYYLWSFEAIEQVVDDLAGSDVLAIDEAEAQEIDRIILRAYKAKWRPFLAVISAIGFGVVVCVTRFGLSQSWTGSHPLPIAMITGLTLGAVYIGSVLVLNLIANIWILHRILKRELSRKGFNVNPLHPDRCGGLRALSNYALTTAYLVAVLGIMVGCIEYQFIARGPAQSQWFVHLIIPLHIALSIVCFFGPLVAAHRGMRKAKERLLHDISKQFQASYAQVRSHLDGDAEIIKKGTEKIQELQTFYALTDAFPIWPFDVQTFRRFLLTATAPVLPLLLGILQKAVGLLLKQWGIELS